MALTDEQYNAGLAQINAGKVYLFGGRSAASVEELDIMRTAVDLPTPVDARERNLDRLIGDSLEPRFNFGPARELVAITPDDDNDIPGGPVRSVWVGAAGDLAVKDLEGNSVTLVGVLAGSVLPIYAVRVLESSTAGSLVGMR